MPTNISCPHCGRETTTGLSVCQGCQAEIVYGASHDETKASLIFGAFAGAAAVFAVQETFGLHPDLSWYLGVAVTGAVLALIGISKIRVGSIRFFRIKRRF